MEFGMDLGGSSSSISRCSSGAQSAAILAFRPRTRQVDDDVSFTIQDRIELTLWSDRAQVARVEVEPGLRGAGPDRASFAAIYVGRDPWSRWGITRADHGVVTWCCRTGRDVAVTRSMSQALEGLAV